MSDKSSLPLDIGSLLLKISSVLFCINTLITVCVCVSQSCPTCSLMHVACQAQSLEFPGQQQWGGLPFPSQTEPALSHCMTLALMKQTRSPSTSSRTLRLLAWRIVGGAPSQLIPSVGPGVAGALRHQKQACLQRACESESGNRLVVWTLCHPMDCSPPGSSVHLILQQEYTRGLPFPSPGYIPDPEIKPRSPVLQADVLILSHQAETDPQWGGLAGAVRGADSNAAALSSAAPPAEKPGRSVQGRCWLSPRRPKRPCWFWCLLNCFLMISLSLSIFFLSHI